MTDPFHDSQTKEPLPDRHAPPAEPQVPPTNLENAPLSDSGQLEPVATDLNLPPSNSPDENYAPLNLPDFNHVTIAHSQQTIPRQATESLTISIELGRQQLAPEVVQELKRGSRITLKQAATDPVDLYIQSDFIGQGELLVRDNKLCIRIIHMATNTLRRSA
jgi:flagellar motor switch/type III secretory pathway protein FliN